MSEMATNTERAADLIATATIPPGTSIRRGMDRAILATKFLADAGLLMPDLPEPSCHNHRNEPIWETEGATKVKTPGMLPVSLIPGVLPISLTGPFNEGWDMHPVEARDIAYALLAAVDHAEQEQSNE